MIQRFSMNNAKNGFKSYLPLILMNIGVFTAASLLFAVILNNPEPVPVFIGFCIIQTAAITLFALLPRKAKAVPRHASKILVGGTLLVLAGFIGRQNFQIEGFFFLALAGFAGGAIIHFGMKVIGTLFTGRGWCSWGCWTAAILDFLPYKNNIEWKGGRLKYLRYAHFLISLILTAVVIFILKHSMQSLNPDSSENWKESVYAVYWIAGGNAFYYTAGIVLAFIFRDNRAFCKYLCPVAVLLKGAGIFSLIRIKPVRKKCSGCGKCESVCPAGIAVRRYVSEGIRITSTECLMCLNCVSECPDGNLETAAGFDPAKKGFLKP
jgi:polyferredoxin